jgi:hypothetical protein
MTTAMSPTKPTTPAAKPPTAQRMISIPLKTTKPARRDIDLNKPTVASAYEERFFLDPILKKLASGGNPFNTIHCQSARRVLDLFRQNCIYKPPTLVISDLRLRHGGAFTNGETGNEFYTGRVLYEYLRRYHNKNLLVVIFTTDKEEYDRLKKIEDPNLKVFLAGLTLGDSLDEVIAELFPQAT